MVFGRGVASMSEWPPAVIDRAIVLNAMRHGPVACSEVFDYAASQFGFDRDEIEAAAGTLGVTRTEIDGEPHWRRPANLVALWWGARRRTWRHQPHARTGGDTA
jgi:hypothetical protein